MLQPKASKKSSRARVDAALTVPRTEWGKATRQRMLSAAEREFSARGFHAVSVETIVSRKVLLFAFQRG